MKTDLPAPLPLGWFPSDPKRSSELHAELKRELPRGHILFEKPVTVVAHREGTDDILCRHIEDPSRFTVIHLSWIRKEEIDASHPWVEDDGDFESFLAYEASYYGR
jgi:hypothetical protein